MKRIAGYGTGILAVALVCIICLLLFSPIQLTDYKEEHIPVGKSVIFLHEGEEIFPLSVIREPLLTPEPYLNKLVVGLGSREEIRINGVRVGIRFSGGNSGDVYLETPGGIPYPPVHFQRLTGGGYGSILEIPDTGIQGDGAMTIPFLIWFHDGEDLITVEIDADLSETVYPWKRYTVQYRTAI